MSSFQFNKIVVVESLGVDDRKTGREVFNDLEFLKIFNPDKLGTEYLDVAEKSEFIRCIECLVKDAKLNGVFPILHIEAHGNEYGVNFSRYSCIEWCELLEILSHLNISMKGNLLVVLASCYGAHIIRHLSNISRAPFWGVIAPYEKTYPENIYTGLTRFYNAVCLGKSSTEIVSALNTDNKNNDLNLFTAELLFVKAAELSVSLFQRKETLEQRIKNMAQMLEKQGGIFDKTEKQLESEFVNLQAKKFEKDLNKFMFVDLYPENANKISKLHNPWRMIN